MPTYKIEMTALIDETTYNTTIDITTYVDRSGIPNINREIDQGDFEIGVFNYGGISINIINSSGKFNEITFDGRSIFPFKRDNAIIEIIYINDAGVETTSFKGLIVDRGTVQDINNQRITFSVLSLDSIFDKIVMNPGLLQNGRLLSENLISVLRNPAILNVLNVSISNINVVLDSIVDDVSVFDNQTVKTVVDQLLFASNSVLTIDSSDNVIVSSRTENSNSPHELFLNDQFRRDNIHSISGFNNGLQRMFNYIVVNEQVAKNESSISLNNTRLLNKTFDFITTDSNGLLIAQSILNIFKNPLDELVVEVDTDFAKDVAFLDKITVNVLPDITVKNGEAPLYEYAVYDVAEYPIENSELTIDSRKIYKIIGIEESPQRFLTDLKLRFTGNYI